MLSDFESLSSREVLFFSGLTRLLALNTIHVDLSIALLLLKHYILHL